MVTRYVVAALLIAAMAIACLFVHPSYAQTTSTTTVTYYIYTVSGLGKIKISTDGVVWVELSPITVTATYANQKVLMNFVASPRTTTVITTTNMFGLNRTITTAVNDYLLILENQCFTKSCFNVIYIPLYLNGTVITTVILDGFNKTRTTLTLSTNIIRVKYCIAGECREVIGTAIEPIYVPPLLTGYIVLVPFAFFVALGIRGDLKAAALGMAACSFIAPILMNLFGIPLVTSVALTALIFFLAVLMTYVASR